MSDLRARIAAAIQAQWSDLTMNNSWDENCLILADAVIRELAIEVEDGECNYCHAMLPGCRYVTELRSK